MSEVRWLDEDESAAWRSWLELSTRVRAAVGRDLARHHGLSDAEYAVLVALSEAPLHRVRMTDLAVRLQWSRSRLSHLVGRMETRGLVARVDCPEDGRGSFTAITDVGLAEIGRAAPAHVASVRRHFLDLLDREELAQLRLVTESVLARLDAVGAPCQLAEDDCAGAPTSDGCGAPSPEGCQETSPEGCSG